MRCGVMSVCNIECTPLSSKAGFGSIRHVSSSHTVDWDMEVQKAVLYLTISYPSSDRVSYLPSFV